MIEKKSTMYEVDLEYSSKPTLCLLTIVWDLYLLWFKSVSTYSGGFNCHFPTAMVIALAMYGRGDTCTCCIDVIMRTMMIMMTILKAVVVSYNTCQSLRN